MATRMEAARRIGAAACAAGFCLAAAVVQAQPNNPACQPIGYEQDGSCDFDESDGYGCPDGGCPDGGCPDGGCPTGGCPDGACGCRNGNCDPNHVRGGLTGYRADDGHKVWRWSDEWYASRACYPVAASRKCKHGLAYPPYPRPAVNADFSAKCHAAHYWPYPFDCWDRNYTRSIMAAQAANGWAQATTLFDYHFDPETQQLTGPGRMHLQWIVQQAPSTGRTVFVQPAGDPQADAARLAVVQTASQSLAGGAAVPVALRATQLAGRPASEVDVIRRAEMGTMPSPRVPFASLNGGAAGGGAPPTR